MPFPFTFSLSVPGLSNPFGSGTRSEQQLPPTPVDKHGSLQSHKQKIRITRPRPPPDSSGSPVLTPLSRKRGWEPAFVSTSQSTTTLASTSGYLDTPSKYRTMTERSADEFHEVEMFADTEMPPPAKRRRGLAGSIVSTALSAALIGTAVGLTVYRLWRDRGKVPPRLEEQHQQPPPPPYQQGNWNPDPPLSAAPQIAPAPTTPRRKKERHPVHSAGKRSLAHRRTRTRTPLLTSSRPSTQFPPSQPEFNFCSDPATDSMEVEDQMDWIGDKLSRLIEEGKRALSREVVVMSDSQEDEVDDGSGAWEEEEDTHTHLTSASPSRTSSLRHSTKRPRGLLPSFAPTSAITTFNATTTHHSLTPSPSGSSFGFVPSSMPQSSSAWPRSVGLGHDMTPSSSWREDEKAWESPELKESMERARARFSKNKAS
ncbi:hypothetical protein E4T56_gene18214 [Termitomyces sp. T112]|nr:hypothetical protein E4T56_gene18214 [Termitomyces sp. T112]KNZ72427.1 hypothetical protein J132_03393 [Termitomyces sp. J132]